MMANAVSRRLFMKTNAAVRYGMVHLLSSTVPLYVVNEFPKSGGSWTSQMLSEALGVPFPRNRFPSLRPSIIQGHFLSPWGMKNVLVVWRDGRDVMVSWYHHCLFKNERHNSFLVDAVRGDLQLDDYSDVRGNLPAFIEYAFTRHRHPRFTWAGFANRWHGRRDVVYTRYEDLNQNTAAELRRICLALSGRKLAESRAAAIADKYSFARQSGRTPGQEDKGGFMRKGVVGDWHNHFTPEARRAFHRYAGRELILLGYEQDEAWVDRED